MTQYRNSDQVKEHHVSVLGEALGLEYHLLWNELAWLYSKWNEYVELYGVKESRVELVNRAAPKFFRIVQDAIWENTLLHLAKLTDPPETMGKENLTVQRLPELVDDVALSEQLKGLISYALEKTKFCRDWRNRKIAHNDLGLATAKTAKKLESASRAKVSEALQAIEDVMNAVNRHYFESETHFKGASVSRGAVALLYLVDSGLRVQAESKGNPHGFRDI